jgi:nucleotide-binding universal stress UspA family protein
MQFTLEDRFRYMDASEEKLRKVRMQRHEEALDAMSAIRKIAGLCSSEVTTVVEHGNLVAVALNLERTLKIDLTVLGAKRTSALQRFFFRSTATEIIEKAACDVLAVPIGTASE